MRRYLLLAILVLLSARVAWGTQYYVNVSTGNDANNGTSQTFTGGTNGPWQTFHKAVATVQPGDIADFANGTYNETSRVTVPISGTASQRITLRSTTKHGAVISFNNINQWGKLYSQQSYWTFQDFDFTQSAKMPGIGATDTLIHFSSTQGNQLATPTVGNWFIGNKCHTVYFDCLKNYRSDDMIVDGNEFYDSDGLAAEATAANRVIWRNNLFYNIAVTASASGCALLNKGGDKSIQVYNNTMIFYTADGSSPADAGAICLGGTTDGNVVEDTTITGYECFNCIAYNNVIISETPGLITYGLWMIGCKDCAIYNNIVRGAGMNVRLQRASGDTAKSPPWDWDPTTKNPKMYNNILMDCTDIPSCISFANIEGTVQHDYNLFYNASGSPTFPTETNRQVGNPNLVNLMSDWHLQAGSIGLGTATPTTFTGYFSESIDTTKDKTGATRTAPWDMGIYDMSLVAGPPVPIAWWKLNDAGPTTAVDEEATYNLTAVNTPTFGVAGSVGMGVSCDTASSEYLQRALAAGSPLMIGTSDFTVTFWIKFASGTAAVQEGVMGTWSTNQYYWFMQRGTDAIVRLNMNHPTLGTATISMDVAVADTSWHHLAVSVTRSSTAQWYLDGVAHGSGSVTAMTGITMSDPAGTEFNLCNIGTHLTGRYLPASLDDVQVYLSALTEAEIEEVMGADLVAPAAPANLRVVSP